MHTTRVRSKDALGCLPRYGGFVDQDLFTVFYGLFSESNSQT